MARSAYDPIDPEDPDDAADIAIMTKALAAADEPTETERLLVEKRGAIVIPKGITDQEFDPEGKLARGMTSESIRGKIRVIDTMADDDSGQTLDSFDVPIDGKSDPDWAEVTEKYLTRMREVSLSPADRQQLTVQIMREVAERKKAKAGGKPRAQRSPTREPTGAELARQRPERQPVLVGVNLGPGLGRLDIAYRDVVISGRTLVLVADPPVPGRFTWTPPEPDPNDTEPRPVELAVSGLDAVVKAFPLGLSYRYDGAIHYVLLIDRPAE